MEHFDFVVRTENATQGSVLICSDIINKLKWQYKHIIVIRVQRNL